MPQETDLGIRQQILEVFEELLAAQLAAVRKLMRERAPQPEPRPKRRSQTGMVHDILKLAGRPLHISTIIEKAKKQFAVELDRESIVSALTKRVRRHDRFDRVAPNTFGLLEHGAD